MNITQEQVDDLNAVLKITLTPGDYEENYSNALKTTRKQIKMPGFRPGNVPMGMVKKMHGKAILAEEINKILNNSIHEYIAENKLDILGNPLPKVEGETGDWDNPGDFEFAFEIGLAPSFDVNISNKDKFAYHVIKVDDALLDKNISDLAKRYGKLSAPEAAGETDMLMGSFVQLDENDAILEGGIMHDSTVSLEFVEDKGAAKALVGKKVGDVVVVDPFKVSKGGADTAAMLGIDQGALESITTNFNFKINDIKRMEPAAIDQDLFDKLFGKDNVTSEEDFRARIKEDLERMFSNDSDRVFQRDASEQLLDKMNLNLPDEFLKKWIMASNDKPITPEQLDLEYGQYAKSLRWQLIENKLIKENEIKVENEEVMAYVKGALVNQYAQYGMMAPEDAELEENAKKVLSNQDEARKIYDTLYNQKITGFLKETAKIDHKEVSYDDFVKLASNHQH